MTRLAEVLEDVAGQAKLYDVTENAIRGARRRKRVRRSGAVLLTVVAALVGVVAVVLPSGGPGRPEGGPGRLDGEPPALVQPLLDAPTRGSLAGDINYIKEVLERVIDDPDRFGLPTDRARLRVLFAGDLPGDRRLVIMAGATGAPRMISLTGPGKADSGKLALTGWADVDEPVVHDEWRSDNNKGYVLVFGPEGYDVSVSSAPRYLADGTVQRTWQPEPAGYVVRDTATLPPGLRVRLVQRGTVFYEAAVGSVRTARAAKIDPNPVGGRGKPAPRAAQAAADALAYSTGLAGSDVHYVVLWSDDFQVDDPNGGGSGLGQIATVMAVTASGGGPYITVATDTSPEPNGRTHPTGAGISGNPDQSVIAMRLPHFTATPPDTLRLIAPPAATRVDLLKGQEVLATVPLSNGTGQVELPGPLQLTVRALDAKGKVLAERQFADLDGRPSTGGYEPDVHNW